MEKNSKYLINIFKIITGEVTSGPDPFEELCGGRLKYFSSDGHLFDSYASALPEYMFSAYGKYIQGEIYELFTKESYQGETEEKEGIYQDYIVGWLYKKEVIYISHQWNDKKERIEIYEKIEELFIKINYELDISLGNIEYLERDYKPKIDIAKLPIKIKMIHIVKDGILRTTLQKVNKIKDNISDLVREILEENGEKPTEEEINEIVKGFKFDNGKK